jgi:phosphate-selective porin OprO/OprP
MRFDHMATERPGMQKLVLTLVVFAVFAQSGSAQQSPSELDVVVERLEQLERDNQRLREQLAGLQAVDQPAMQSETSGDAQEVIVSAILSGPFQFADSGIYQPQSPQVFFNSTARQSLLTESDVRNIVSDTVHQQSDSSPTELPPGTQDAVQNQRILELDRALQGLQSSAGRKTYPNLTVNGVFQADAGWIHQDFVSEAQYGQIQDGSDFRRARLSAKGSVTEQTNYFFQMDFGFFGRPTFTDVWLEQTNVPLLGNVRIGQWKQPFSLETVSSFRYTTFMERSVLFQPFTPFRHIGIGFYDYADDLSATWAASAFRTGQDQFGATLSSNGGYGTAERFTCLPAWECNGKNYLHLGVGHFFNAPPGDSINFRTIPEFFVGANGPGAVGTSGQAVPGGSNGTPFFVATGNLNVPFYNVLGSELLWVNGPISVQSEAMINLVNQSGGETAVLPGAYAQLGFFLTGEHRPYDRKAGAIDRVIPRSNLSFAGSGRNAGCGAWELAGRWSYLDLNDSGINGGTITDYTAGINWYWNPHTKMVFNYVHAVSDTPAFPIASTDMFGVRAQIDF